MRNYKTHQNRYEYKTRILQIKQQARKNYETMENFEKKEIELVEKLKTTFAQVKNSQAELRALEKGNAYPIDLSSVKPRVYRSLEPK